MSSQDMEEASPFINEFRSFFASVEPDQDGRILMHRTFPRIDSYALLVFYPQSKFVYLTIGRVPDLDFLSIGLGKIVSLEASSTKLRIMTSFAIATVLKFSLDEFGHVSIVQSS